MELVNSVQKWEDWHHKKFSNCDGTWQYPQKTIYQRNLIPFHRSSFPILYGSLWLAVPCWHCRALVKKNREKCGMKHWASMNMFREITPC